MSAPKGFSLLELLVVLVIFLAVAIVVPPLVSGLVGSTELRATARQLAAGMRYARSAAITQRQPATVTVNLAEHRFAVTGRSQQVVWPARIAVQLYTAQSELIDATSGNIRFFPDGSSTGGHVILADGRLSYRVNVDWLTGRVNIVEQGVNP